MRILIFGDDIGVPEVLNAVSSDMVCGIVASGIRPEQHPALSKLAYDKRIPCIVQPKVLSYNFKWNIRALKPDLIVCNSYSLLIPPEILSIPNLGAVNIHSALLPKYRGPNPIQWAIINGETATGVTMHYMDGDYDTGDMISQKVVSIRLADTWVEVMGHIRETTQALLMKEVPNILAGTNGRHSQNNSIATRYSRRHPEDGLFSWEQPAIEIYNKIRALVRPLPGAFYMDKNGNKVVLDKYLTLQEVTNLKYGER